MSEAASEAVSESTAVAKRSGYVAVPNDGDQLIPVEYVGQPIAPNYFCRFWNPTRSKYCGARAGRGTTHLGMGRCKRHGGGNGTIITGRKSKYLVHDRSVIAKIEHHASDPTLLDMRNELTVLCALLDGVLEKPSFDRVAAERLLVEISRMKERIHNSTAKNAYSVEQMKRFWMAMVRTIEFVLKDQPEIAAKLVDKLGEIQI